jgi:hypothetical protein
MGTMRGRYTQASDEAGVTLMQEVWVESIVRKMLDVYEKEIGRPRHDQNSGRLDSIEGTLSKVEGGIQAIKWICGIVGSALVVMQIMRLFHSGVLRP